MITTRDLEVLDFIDNFKVAKTSTIQELFYPSLLVAQRRLKTLSMDYKELSRARDNVSSEYIYYRKAPSYFKHSVIRTDFYRELHKIAKIEYFENEISIGNVKCDGLIGYRINNKNYLAFLEVQTRNNSVDIAKYEKLFKTEEYKKHFPVFPIIIAITNRKLPESNLKIIHLKENLSNMEVLK